jgi:hypothetical protein
MGATTDTITRPASAKSYTGRIVAIVSLLIGLAGAAAPVALNMDISSTAGIAAGIVALSVVIVKYLDGWQKYEARIDDQAALVATDVATDTPAPSITGTPPAAVPPSKEPPPAEDPTPEPDVPPAPSLSLIPPPVASAPPMTGTGSDADLVGVADEPDAPMPGALDEPVEPEPGDELADIPDPPTDEEIAAVEYELSQGLPPARAA